jgi:tripartite-type tricarboxylate transporter receptor subunit TctC
VSYDVFKDLTPVSVVSDFDYGLIVGPALPGHVATLADFIVWTKDNPAEANCATPGEGSLSHLLLLQLAKTTAAPLQAVP